MKKDFEITEVREFTNGETGHKFLQLNLMHKETKMHDGCKVEVRKYADFICEETTKQVGDKFTFDSDIMDITKREWLGQDGLVKTSFRIYLK